MFAVIKNKAKYFNHVVILYHLNDKVPFGAAINTVELHITMATVLILVAKKQRCTKVNLTDYFLYQNMTSCIVDTHQSRQT